MPGHAGKPKHSERGNDSEQAVHAASEGWAQLHTCFDQVHASHVPNTPTPEVFEFLHQRGRQLTDALLPLHLQP